MKNIFLITELEERKASPGAILAWRDGGDIDSQKRKRVALARIFHPSLLRKPGRLMDAALDLNFGLNSMYAYSPAPKSNFDSLAPARLAPSGLPEGSLSRGLPTTGIALPHRPRAASRHDVYEISELVDFMD